MNGRKLRKRRRRRIRRIGVRRRIRRMRKRRLVWSEWLVSCRAVVCCNCEEWMAEI